MIDEIGRQGRALGVRLLMGSQRLGHEMESGHHGQHSDPRGAAHAWTSSDSRAVLGIDEAKWLPVKPAGAGFSRWKAGNG